MWSLKRVLLAGKPGGLLRIMESRLRAAGARPHAFCTPPEEESLCRALHQGRYACVIAPDLPGMCPGDAKARFAALVMLLGEAREAGVPLVMLLSPASCAEAVPLFSHAMGWAQGACGDPVSVQCIRHTGADAARTCEEALALGARFLSGERSCTGIFTLT